MTQTPQQPRDWQKDMERTRHFEYARMLRGSLPFPPELDTDPTEVALKYWLQKYADESNSVCFWKGEHDKEKARAEAAEARVKELEDSRRFEFIGKLRRDAAEKETLLAEEIIRLEAREQRLKEAAEKVSEIYGSDYTDEEAVNAINDMFLELLSTLYPDTPAPKEGTKNKCPGCGSCMVPQWGGDEGPDSHWEECKNPDCDYEEGDNQ